MHDDSDASGPQDESSGYESESESGEVRKKRTSRSRDSSVRRRDQDDGRKHYPKRAVHKIALFEVSTNMIWLDTNTKKYLFLAQYIQASNIQQFARAG
jgi:hypothetical protein